MEKQKDKVGRNRVRVYGGNKQTQTIPYRSDVSSLQLGAEIIILQQPEIYLGLTRPGFFYSREPVIRSWWMRGRGCDSPAAPQP